MSKVKQLAGQTIIYGVGQILPRLLHYIVFSTYLTYRLSEQQADYYVYLDMYAWASIIVVLFSYRMDTAMFRFGRQPEELPRVYSTAFSSLIISAVVLVLVGTLGADWISSLMGRPDKPYYITWFGWILAFDVLNLLPFAKLRLQDHALTFVKYKVFNIALTILLVLLFLEWMPERASQVFPFCDGDIDFVFLANLIASGALFTLLMVYHFPKRVKIDKEIWSRMARYSWPLVIVGVAGSINQFFAAPLQGMLLDKTNGDHETQAAIYGAVQKIPVLLALFTTAYNYAAEPFFFRNAEERGSRKMYADIALYFVIIVGIVGVGINSLVDIFSILIGPGFRSGLYLLPILLMAYIFLGIYYNVSIWYKLSDKTRYGAIIASIGSLVTLTGSIILLPMIGVSASAWVALLCYVTMVVIALRLGQQHYAIPYDVGRIGLHLMLITAFLIAGAYINATHESTLIYGILTMIAYLGVLAFVERERVSDVLRMIKTR